MTLPGCSITGRRAVGRQRRGEQLDDRKPRLTELIADDRDIVVSAGHPTQKIRRIRGVKRGNRVRDRVRDRAELDSVPNTEHQRPARLQLPSSLFEGVHFRG